MPVTARPGYIWDGTQWVPIGNQPYTTPVKIQATAPTSPATGDIWVDTSTYVQTADPATFIRNSGIADFTNNTALVPPTPFTFRNKIINGDLSVWQRGTSFSFSGASGNYTADRWAFYTDGTGSAVTVSRQAFTAGSAPVTGYESTYFLRVNRTGVGTGLTYSNLQQAIEDVRTLAGQTVTLSFWAKADSAKSLPVSLTQDFGTGGSTAVGVGTIGTAAVTTSWQRFSYTTTLPSIAGKTISATDSKLYVFLQMGNAVSTFDVWGIQLEAGSAATPYEQKPFYQELRDCQRYYEVLGSGFSGQFYSASNCTIGGTYKVTKRAAVSPTLLSNATVLEIGVGNRTATSISGIQSATVNGSHFDLIGMSGATSGKGAALLTDSIAINAEL